jgi:hypothetical protein
LPGRGVTAGYTLFVPLFVLVLSPPRRTEYRFAEYEYDQIRFEART